MTRKEFEERLQKETGLKLIAIPPKTNLITVEHNYEEFSYIARGKFDNGLYFVWRVEDESFDDLFNANILFILVQKVKLYKHE